MNNDSPSVNESVLCYYYDDKGNLCGDEATALVRMEPGGARGYQAAQLKNAKIPVCEGCGESLTIQAEIGYEFLERFMESSEIRGRKRLPDNWIRYENQDVETE